MDNKIILELIKKDLEDIKVLIEALEQSPTNDQILIDITTSKAKTLLQEITLLKGEIKSETHIEPSIIDDKEKRSLAENELSIKEEISQRIVEETTVVPELKNEIIQPIPVPEEDNNIDIVETVADVINSEKENSVEQTELELTQKEEPIAEEVEDLPLEERKIEVEKTVEKPPLKESRIIGETFTKEPSLNERFASVNDLKSKIVGKPVISIKGAIGINDKFMYSRELFNNNQEKFNSTVEALDNAASLIEAIEYLELNFKWQKNDVSLKFMELVKRRFEN